MPISAYLRRSPPISACLRRLRDKLGRVPLMVPPSSARIFDDRDRVLLYRATADGR
jgi:hypothetical protein